MAAGRFLVGGTARPTRPAAVPPEGAATGVVNGAAASTAAAETTAVAVGAIAARVMGSAAWAERAAKGAFIGKGVKMPGNGWSGEGSQAVAAPDFARPRETL